MEKKNENEPNLKKEIENSLVQATALLEDSLRELNVFLSESEYVSACSDVELANALDAIAKVTLCSSEIRSYLNKINGREKSVKVKDCLDSLSESIRILCETQLPSTHQLSKVFVHNWSQDVQKVIMKDCDDEC